MGATPLDPAVAALVRGAHWVTVCSGAGMSAESNVPTFRDAETGLWERFDPTELATPEAWSADPALVWAWYQWRARLVRGAEPNAGHRALAQWAQRRTLMVVTQNVDDLHERAGSSVSAHLHGSLFAPRCSNCGTPYDGTDADPDTATETLRVEPPACPRCLSPVRPGVVWFGEPLPQDAWDRAADAAAGCDLLIVVGTSGLVYPAASLPERALAAGIPVIEINPDPTPLSSSVTHFLQTTAGRGLPALLEHVRAADD
ncbi:NAD-dependent deacylase [Williamsia sp. 1135]|uniref:SIR2 family NAD-dependent protein deacylase n=1 Tax=Williamsia sp. 1135 TaxID=1889262 RepID=UPI000A120FC4|nr:NAD-dependent deacylase [Williamsia sp. 1135]ORM36315.1 NAD-dependent deacylase [Williamsia sp. 1135]